MNSIVEIWEELSKKYNSRIALKDETTGYSLTFQEFNDNINKIVTIIRNFSIKKDDKVIIFMKQHPLWHVIDQGIMKNESISVPCDPISSFEEIKDIIKQTKSNVIFTDNIKFVDVIAKLQEYSTFIIFYVGNSSDVNKYKNYNNIYSLKEYLEKTTTKNISIIINNPNNVASIVYSSGTTSVPKGVMFTHQNLFLSFNDHKQTLEFEKNKQAYCVSILNSSHIAPRLNDLALLSEGNTVIYSNYIDYLSIVKKYKPKYLLCVPKLLNMLVDEYKREFSKKTKIFQIIHNIFFNISNLSFKYKNSENIIKKFLSLILNFLYLFGHKYFFKVLISKFLNVSTIIITFGAKMQEDTEKFLNIIGLNLMAQYGLTESCVCNAYSLTKSKRFGSVGRVNPNINMIICDVNTNKELGYNQIGLIKVKGKQIMKGYFGNIEMTKKVFDDNGYLITGDLGYITKDKYLYFVGRQKDIIVLNNGENVNLNRIEYICKQSKFIKQIVVCGQDKPYLTALIVLNELYKSKNNIDVFKKDVLIDINNLIGNNKYFKWLEQIKDCRFVDKEFSCNDGLMTKKYTIVRNKVYEQYKNLIDSMY